MTRAFHSKSPSPSEASARERILDTAESRLLELGQRGLVLSAVATQAGVSKGGLLYHFPSKEALNSVRSPRIYGQPPAC